MKVEFHQSPLGYWYWVCGSATTAGIGYSRRRDAVRGFERFQARVRAM